MFTGLVEEIGHIQRVTPEATGVRITVEAARVLEATAVGDSIAVNGCCLTVVELGPHSFSAHAGTETLARTTVGSWRPGKSANLERALSAGSRLGGHFVQGHVDGVGALEAVMPEGETTRLRFWLPAELSLFVVEKGSIAVDGISLTVTACRDEAFEVAIIPHTLGQTTLGALRPQEAVNLETDILAKYVHRMLGALGPGKTTITEEFLREHGFC
jgi:riboflavin synthase